MTEKAPKTTPETPKDGAQPPAGGTDSTTADAKAREERDNALKGAYQAATRRLREEFKDYFNRFYAEEAEARGQEWKPKPTKEEKAKAELDALLEQYPSLRDTFGS